MHSKFRNLVITTVLLLTRFAVANDTPLIQEVWERFDSKMLQRNLWDFDPRSPAGTMHSIDADSWKMSIPGGTADRAPANLISRCQFKGNFRLEMDLQLLKVPTLKNGNIQIGIFISGPDGHAAVMRAIYKELGHGYSIWHQPIDSQLAGHWENHPTNAMSGKIQMRRQGSELIFEATSTGEKKAKPIGRIQFGDGPIERMEIRVVVPETRGMTQVVVDNIHMTADQIVRPQPAAASMTGQRAWLTAVILCVLLVVGGGMSIVYQRCDS